jgi:hypothetical protein
METMKNQILRRIEKMDAGSVFSAKDFLDLASRTSIDVLLSKLAKNGTIRRISRGLYDLPRFNPDLESELSPDMHEAAQAIARRQRWKIIPEGAWAANVLGLSTQVPSKIMYLTDGPKHEIHVGRRTIFFKHARPKTLTGSGEKFSLVVQALRYLGKQGVGPQEIEHLQKVLTAMEKKNLLKDTRYGTEWIYDVAKRVAEGMS